MVSDQEIAKYVESLLRQSDPSATVISPVNVGTVVQQLEAKLGLDLSHKAEFIRDHITTLLRPSQDHFALQQQHLQQQLQQQQRQLQQQYMSGYSHQLLPPHHQITQSPFTHLPHQHELAFRCASPVQMQQQSVSATSVAAKQKQEGSTGNSALGSSVPAAPAKGSSQTGVKRRGGPGGLNKVCGVSPELQAIVGEPTMARTQIVKQLWAYIRKNNLQDPNNKRKIICNDELRLVFETDCTDMFKMNKLLAKHIITLEPPKESGADSKRIKTVEDDPATERESDTADCPLVVSDALAEFFGTEEREMLRLEALKRIWDYIKANQLEDPSNPMVIQFDSKLQQLFGCTSLSAIGISEMLSRHLFKKS